MKKNVLLLSCFFSHLAFASAFVKIEPDDLFTMSVKDGAVTFSNLSDQNLYIHAPEGFQAQGVWLPEKVDEKYILTVKPKYGPTKTSEITFKRDLTEIPDFMYDLKYSVDSYISEKSFKRFERKQLDRYIALQNGVLRMTSSQSFNILYANSILTIPGGYNSEVNVDKIASELGYKRKLDLSEFKVFKEDDGCQNNFVKPEEMESSSDSEEEITYSESLPSELTFYVNGVQILEENLPNYIEVSHSSGSTSYKNIGSDVIRPRVSRKLGRCIVSWDNDVSPGQILIDRGNSFSRTSAGW